MVIVMKQNEDLKRKIELCNKLGANKFKPWVLRLEKLKFKILKKFFPSLPTRFEKYYQKNRDKKLKKANSNEERERILHNYRHQIIEFRRELINEQNRNYHINKNNPTEIIKYLYWNKKIHQKGLIKDSILIILTTIGLFIGLSPAILFTLLFTEIISLFINFQCINIQNSHIYRYKLIEKSLQKRKKQHENKLINDYSKIATVYNRSIQNNNNLPSLENIISNIKTTEELEQLKKLIINNINNRKTKLPINKDIQKNNTLKKIKH